ncbi:Aste57867_14579 [Aphanomyces stellatus]|uniref:Aste57867_14579 protein n=1 Tax=Aphanomyces stellatus TaxID=120398 RepID=A0A485L1U9_9STRA|nr:hypothetical protein As57867_014525 [Aphanomyces stellatus]VFT91398.1 Aste57867_14579 [Aphanomyces stellatus]
MSKGAIAVLLSEDLFDRIKVFQHGMHLDMRPLKALTPVSPGILQGCSHLTNECRAAMERIDALLTPWYAAHGTSRIPCLFRWFKHTYGVVATHAAYFGKLETLEYLHDVYTIRFFRDLPLWNVAAANGHLHVLGFLHTHLYVSYYQSAALTCAGASGALAAVDWLHSHSILCDIIDAQDMAAEFGQLEVLQWLHARGIGEITTWGMDRAAKNGHIDVLAWLYDHTNVTCTTNAMDDAARNGHLDALEWLHAHQSKGATNASVQYAAEHGHTDVVLWLLVHQPQMTKTALAMEAAAHRGHLEVVQALHDFGWPSTKRVMERAAAGGHLHVLQWLRANRTEGCTTAAMDDAAREGHLEVVQWLHEHYEKVGCSMDAMDSAAMRGHLEVVLWLHRHRREGCSDRGLFYAIQSGQLEMVQWFSRHRQEFNGAQKKEAGIQARRQGHTAIAQYLEAAMPNECHCSDCGAMSAKQPSCCIS